MFRLNYYPKYKEDAKMLSETNSELQKVIEKQNRLIRFQSLVQSLILVFLIGIVVVGGIIYFRVKETLTTVEVKIAEVDTESLNRSIAALDQASANLEGLDAVAINDSVTSLNDAADNLSKIDTEQMNEMTESLNNSAKSLEEVTDGLSNLFG